jgi:FkbM family methyltransferase
MNPLLAALSLLPGFEKELRLLPLLVKRGAVSVDVGAALGAYAIPMALLAGASGLVLAYEPRHDAAQRLRRIAGLLGLAALRVENAALGATTQTTGLVVPRRRRAVPGRSYLTAGAVCDGLDEGLLGAPPLEVSVHTLDDVRSDIGLPIEFVKCDVEGFELDVFRGSQHVLTHDRPVVLCELEERHALRYGRTVNDVVQLFRGLDYGTPTPVANSRNVLFVPKERSIPALQ